VFEGGGQAELPPVDLKALHANIDELTLENNCFGRCAHQGRTAERKTMIDRTHRLPIARQAEALRISRSTDYALAAPISENAHRLMKRMGIEALYRKPRTTRKHPPTSRVPMFTV